MADHSKTAEYSQNPYGIIDDITHLSPCPSIYPSLHSPLKYTLLRLHKQTNKTEREMAPAESVVVVMDANHRKVSVEAVDWAIKHIVRPRDTVVVLGVLSEVGKKTTTSSSSSSSSCLPFHVGASLSRILRIEFSGHGEMNRTELEEEIEKKREEFHSTFQPFYRRCKKNEYAFVQVKLEVILAAGYDPCEKTIEQAQNYNTQWIVLDSHLKKHKAYIHGRVTCNIAVFKGKDVATLISSRTPEYKTDGKSVANVGVIAKEDDELQHEVLNPPEKSFIPAPTTPPSPCWYPLSWRTGFPRAFSISELGEITNGFADSNIVVEEHEKKVYKGIYQETRVLIKLFSASDDQFWSLLKILSRVRHRNILNLVGYCCTDASLYLLCDYPCNGTVETNLLCDESAKRLSWRVRWYIALEIGIGLRYLHEECVDGPIADLSVCSTYVVFSSGSTVMLSIFNTAKWLKDDLSHNEDPPADLNAEEDKHLLADIHDYGLFLIELITGKSAQYFQKQAKGQSLIDWALPYLENGSLNQVMDPRVTDTSDTGVVSHMSRAALLCLKNDTAHKFSISEVLAVVRGDQFAVSNS
ncbi:proline-rich receptor-like protein kinase PERK2 isoform X2 [Camellia sinensis]|uniref:proline-rich receptor-like protein kinase PERK2 isoform X2 n=1 Tax=Camellia sinensis TaxID=4442 RepID=UPI00103632E4|nr:proline-rich receptor-like protein kinase PERK2 isoform X2 [Camellia sinensis]